MSRANGRLGDRSDTGDVGSLGDLDEVPHIALVNLVDHGLHLLVNRLKEHVARQSRVVLALQLGLAGLVAGVFDGSIDDGRCQEIAVMLAQRLRRAGQIKLNPGADYVIRENEAAFVIGDATG